jgi:hypothetical protein
VTELQSDELEQILQAWAESSASAYSYGLGEISMQEEDAENDRLFGVLMQVIKTLEDQSFTEGMAAGFLIAGRHDLIARDPVIEKAAAVIMAVWLKRKDIHEE